MTIEQHAEAAVREYWDAANKADGHGKAMTHYIAKHMQSAIDEATAPLRARIAELEGLVDLTPVLAKWGGYVIDEGWYEEGEVCQVLSKINAILKGGGS